MRMLAIIILEADLFCGGAQLFNEVQINILIGN